MIVSSNPKKGVIQSFINPYSYLQIRNKPEAVNIDLFMVDGISLVWLLRIFGIRVSRKSFDFTSLASSIFSDKSNNDFYFIGSTEYDIQEFVRKVKKAHPSLSLSGFRHGFFDDIKAMKNTIDEITQLSPKTVVVGMGAPLQEEFLISLRSHGWNGTGFTCGGFIRQTAKRTQYYPALINKLNLRWLYRILDEPVLLRRYLIDYPIGMLFFLLDLLKGKITVKKQDS